MMKQTRKGRYTKPISKTTRFKRSLKRGSLWFRKLSLKQKIAVIAGPILLILIIIPIATYLYYANDIKDQERLMNRNNTGVVFKDRHDKTFYSIGKAESRDMIKLDDISDYLQQALIASEDKDFYKHGGFSLLSIGRAAITGYGGGSTISQQLAKNTLLTNQRSLLRKYQELFISIAIEQNYTKDEILTMYLNSVFYGENAFGIADAAKTYFDKTPKELTLAESAMLIGVLPAPSAYSPISGNPEYAKERQTTVLKRMRDNGYISEAQLQTAVKQKLAYADQDENTSTAPHFVEMVLNQLNESYGTEQVMRSGYQVTTTLDLELQKQVETNIKNHIGFIQANGGSNASAIAIDPQTGEVRALAGSADYNNQTWGKVNMTTSARQPGSSYKPIYYAGALAQGVITPATVYTDEPIDIDGYSPQNADRTFRGDVTVRSAIDMSLNIPSVKVMQDYGIENAVEISRQLGIDTIQKDKPYGLSLALGSAEATLTDMTNAYAAFANQGQQFDTTIIKSINNKYGKRIFATDNKPKEVISAGGAFLISDILADNAARAPVFGSSLSVPGHTAAVKTGTTDDNRDAWTIGYTPGLAVGVWVGNNDNTTMLNGGSGMAGPIWQNTMIQALSGQPDDKFDRPDSVVQRSTCYSNHGIAINDIKDGTYPEYYLASALPEKTCTPTKPKPIEVCNTRTMKIVSIEEKDFDKKIHSKDLKDCQEKPPKMIEVCDLATGEVVTIKEDDFDSELYSRDTNNCTAPDDDGEEPDPDDPGLPTIPTPPRTNPPRQSR